MLQNKKVAIVGGGPGGLTLARLLQQKDVHVTVFERDADRHARQQGATLDLHEDSGLRALDVAGLMPEFRANYRPGADKTKILNAAAEVVFDDHASKPLEDFGEQTFRPEIDRGPLRGLLLDSLKPETIVWNAQFLDMKPQGAGWELTFNNGQSVYADLVVGVDGANSKVRRFVTDIQPIYSGMTMIECNIFRAATNAPKLNAVLNGGKIFALGNDKSILLSAKGDGTLSFATGTWEDEFWWRDGGVDFGDRTQVFAWFRDRFADWSPAWHELFGSDDMYLIPRPLYHYPLDQAWAPQPNLTLLGDAAHWMPPYAGEGVNMAMQDALELFENLTSGAFADMKSAIGQYEKRMFERASEVTRGTLDNMRFMHAPGGLEGLVAMFSGVFFENQVFPGTSMSSN